MTSMKDIFTLLSPRLLSFKNNRNRGKARLLLFGGIGALLWGGLFVASLRILAYFQSIEEIGDILAWKLLSMVLIVYFSLLVFSSILTSLSKLYLSKDLILVHSMPVPGYKIFLSRWIESTVDSSWTIILFTLPVLISYGVIYATGPLYYLMIALVLVFLSMTASIISAALVMVAVIVIPPGRIKSIFVFLGLFLFLLLYLAFRLVRPERLVDPEAFDTVLSYLAVLNTPASPLLPTTWAFDALVAALTGFSSRGIFNLSLLASFACALVFISTLIAEGLYTKGVSKSQTARKTLFKPKTVHRSRAFFFLPQPVRAYVVKEIKTFFRDQTQWSQIFLIIALIIIYVYNFKVLPLERSPIKTVYLQNLLAFLNMGLAAFVLTAVTGRFAYPAVSMEGEAFWIVSASPMRLSTFLKIKFFIYLFPLMALTEVLIIATNLLLQVSVFMMWLSTLTILFIVPAVVSLGIGIGAAYPDFNAENPAQAITSFGGLMFMMLSVIYIGLVIVLEAGPVYQIFMSGIFRRAIPVSRWCWIIGSFLTAGVLTLITIMLPIKYGEQRLHYFISMKNKPYSRGFLNHSLVRRA